MAQAQRDLLASRIAEVQALANYLKALIDLYQQDGSPFGAARDRRARPQAGRSPGFPSSRMTVAQSFQRDGHY